MPKRRSFTYGIKVTDSFTNTGFHTKKAASEYGKQIMHISKPKVVKVPW